MSTSPVTATRNLLDRQLGRITMYRLVTVVLSVLVAIYAVFTATGVIEGLSTGDALISLAVLLVASVVSGRLLGLAFRVRPHTESSVITALLLFFLFVPIPEVTTGNLVWLALAAIMGNASKYLLAWRGRHVFNPAAAGAFLIVVGQELVGRDDRINAIWQTAATEKLFPFVVIGALLVLYRTRRLDLGLVFAVIAFALIVARLLELSSDQSFGDVLKTATYSYPIVFLAGFMLSEPLTLPPRRRQQLAVAAVTGVVFAYPLAIGWFTDSPPSLGVFAITPELALLIGNLVAFVMAPRRGMRLELVERRERGGDTHELVFATKNNARFAPGQYAELHLPHAKTDLRGARRSFSISSPPTDDGTVTFALRVPTPASSFKRAMLGLEPGATVQATGVYGDFVAPRDHAMPVVMIAGGIGITPFLSQLRHRPDCDAVVVYGVPSGDDIPFAEELAASRVVLVSPTEPPSMPKSWTWVQAEFLTADLVAQAVPDLASRRAYVSGPPGMVNAVRAGLAKRTKGVRTDYFSGY